MAEQKECKVKVTMRSRRSLSRQHALEIQDPPNNDNNIDNNNDNNTETATEITANHNNVSSNDDSEHRGSDASRDNNFSNNSNNNDAIFKFNHNNIIHIQNNNNNNDDDNFHESQETQTSFESCLPNLSDVDNNNSLNDKDNTSKLHTFARNGNLEMVKALLLLSGADVNRLQSDGSVRSISPLNLAVRKGHFDVAQCLLRAGAHVNSSEEALVRKRNEWMVSYTPLHWAVENGDEEMVKLLLKYGADYNKQVSLQDHQFVSPLHLAAQDGNVSICRLLLSNSGCLRDPVKVTPKRNMITPLHQAAFNGHTETVRLLLEMGCDPNKQADNGYAALHYACQIGDPEMVETILLYGGRHDLKSFTEVQFFITPLHLAVQSADEMTIRMLVKYGADLQAEKILAKVGGVTPLHQAVYQNKVQIVKLLIDLGADVHSKSGKTWYTVCHIAAERGHSEVMDFLLSPSVKANVNARATLGDHVDVTPLHVASQFGQNGIIKKLLKAGADINCVRRFGNRTGITCLHLAVEFGHIDTVQLLTSLGCNVNAMDSLKYTPLHAAIHHCRLDIVRLLLSSEKCDLKLKTLTGLTPKQMAQKTNASIEIAALFRDKEKSKMRRVLKNRRTKSAVFKYLCGL